MSKQTMCMELLQQLQERYAQGTEIIGEGFQQALLVKAEYLLELMQVLKSGPAYQFNLLSNLTAVDYLEYFEVVYHLYSLPLRQSFIVKSRCGTEQPQFDSVVSVWLSADFQEREIYDLLGIRFAGHPNLRRILLPEGFADHPLRKTYTLMAAGEGISHAGN